jgi:hypothetical protein
MTPFAYFNQVVWDLGFWQNLNVASHTLISKPFSQGLIVMIKVQSWERSHVK